MNYHLRIYKLRYTRVRTSVKKYKKWSESLGMVYQANEANPGLLSKPLDNALSALEVGETSDPIIVDGRVHMIRVKAIRTIAPKPLSEVSTKIRKSLAPLQLRKAVKRVTKRLMGNADIKRFAKQG